MGNYLKKLRVSGANCTSWFLLWNLVLWICLPAEILAIVPLSQRSGQKERFHPEHPLHLQQGFGQKHWGVTRAPLPYGTFPYPTSFQQINQGIQPVYYFDNRKSQKPPSSLPPFNQILRKQKTCDGRSNLLQDLGVLAIVSGIVGTLLSIFTASYFSVAGNVVSVISGLISYATGIPSAIITYLAASDRLSYAIANVLSVLSIANTAYGFWSVDFGNKDIITSQIANIIGVFSLVISILTAYPELFDATVMEMSGKDPIKRREIQRFIDNYGCFEGEVTYYEKTKQYLKKFLASL